MGVTEHATRVMSHIVHLRGGGEPPPPQKKKIIFTPIKSFHGVYGLGRMKYGNLLHGHLALFRNTRNPRLGHKLPLASEGEIE